MIFEKEKSEMKDNERPIAVFDSGIGGVSVLRELAALAPNENILYYGDSENAPYGEKSPELVRELTFSNVENLLRIGAKALVVTCNTATSAAVRDLRGMYPTLPIVGIEPAIKPAVIYGEQTLSKTDGSSKIIVMATPVTISQAKFARLIGEYEGRAEIIPLPCPRLAEMIETGDINSTEIKEYLKNCLVPFLDADSVVLGCTHYPFIRRHIEEILPGAKIFDGGFGTAKEAVRRIKEAGLENRSTQKGNIEFVSSKDKKMSELYRRFFEMEL